MNKLAYARPVRIQLRANPEYDEKWVQDLIVSDPSILGLGDLRLKDKERRQPQAGRLDILLEDIDDSSWYEIEVQLGATDPSHIIRTIEYWDYERKRFPNYEHIAVIVAEDITSRFLNVINLFNGFIPLIALQMQAVRVGDSISLIFTKVLDKMPSLASMEDEGASIAVDRGFWDKQSTKEYMNLRDDLLGFMKTYDPQCKLKYNQAYIVPSQNGRPKSYAFIWAQKKQLRISIRLPNEPGIAEAIEAVELSSDGYRGDCWRLKLHKDDFKDGKRKQLVTELLKRAFEEWSA